MKTKLGFFGAGKMAEGILAAASLAKDFDPKSVLMAEKLPARAKELEKKYGVRTTSDAKLTEALDAYAMDPGICIPDLLFPLPTHKA